MIPVLSRRLGSRRRYPVCALAVLLCCAAMPANAAQSPVVPATVQAPVRIAAMPGDRLLVSDNTLQAIIVIDRKTLSVERTIPVGGRPVAVVWAEGRIFVGNETLGQVQIYSPDGRLTGNFGAPGSIGLPNALAYDDQTYEVLVLDALEKVVKVFTIEGQFLRLLTQPGALANPTAMSFDRTARRVLVSDFGTLAGSIFSRPKPVVHQLDLAGTEVAKIDGTGTGTFVRPQGLALDAAGRLYVVDSYDSRIYVFDAAGAPLGNLGGFGGDPGQLSLPLDILDSPKDKTLYVTDHGNGRIAAFPEWVTP